MYIHEKNSENSEPDCSKTIMGGEKLFGAGLVFCIPPETSPEKTFSPEPSPRQAFFLSFFVEGNS